MNIAKKHLEKMVSQQKELQIKNYLSKNKPNQSTVNYTFIDGSFLSICDEVLILRGLNVKGKRFTVGENKIKQETLILLKPYLNRIKNSYKRLFTLTWVGILLLVDNLLMQNPNLWTEILAFFVAVGYSFELSDAEQMQNILRLNLSPVIEEA